MATSAKFVGDLVRGIIAQGGEVWLDGGWGVDALLSVETRPHDDVDIVLQEHHLKRVTKMLELWGFVPLVRADTRAWNFVLADDTERQVDFHVVVFDENGNGIYGPPEDGNIYPAEAFKGRGTVANTPVKCMSVAFQMANRKSYDLRKKDYHDIEMLKAKFSI